MGRPKGKRNVPDSAFLNALPGATQDIADRVGLTRAGALYRLKRLPRAVGTRRRYGWWWELRPLPPSPRRGLRPSGRVGVRVVPRRVVDRRLLR